MNSSTKIAGVLFAYFCYSTARILAYIFTPLGLFLHYCFGENDWRERRDRNIDDVAAVIAHITPPLTWMSLTLSTMVFWAKILERFFFFDDHAKVANGTMILLVITILPFVIWWVRNKDLIIDVKKNLFLGEKNKEIYVLSSFFFFLLQISMPFVMLWL